MLIRARVTGSSRRGLPDPVSRHDPDRQGHPLHEVRTSTSTGSLITDPDPTSVLTFTIVETGSRIERAAEDHRSARPRRLRGTTLCPVLATATQPHQLRHSKSAERSDPVRDRGQQTPSTVGTARRRAARCPSRRRPRATARSHHRSPPAHPLPALPGSSLGVGRPFTHTAAEQSSVNWVSCLTRTENSRPVLHAERILMIWSPVEGRPPSRGA